MRARLQADMEGLHSRLPRHRFAGLAVPMRSAVRYRDEGNHRPAGKRR